MAERGAFHNSAPAEAVPDHVSRDIAKVEFARRLSNQLVLKGWNQSDLAAAATKIAPAGIKIGRDSVSNYIRAKNLPTPVHLKLLSDALGCTTNDLMPTRGTREAGDTAQPAELKDMGQGTAWLRINEVVPWQVALQVMAILRGSEEKE